MTKFLVYVSLCFWRQLLFEKPTLHSMYSKCLSPGCICICSFKWPFGEQHSLYSIWLNGVSILSVWIHVFRIMKIQHRILLQFQGFPSVCFFQYVSSCYNIVQILLHPLCRWMAQHFTQTPQHPHQVQSVESLTSAVRLSRPCLTHSRHFDSSSDWAAWHLDQLSERTDGSCEQTEQISVRFYLLLVVFA